MRFSERLSAESSTNDRSQLPLYNDSKPSFRGKIHHLAVKVTRRHVLILIFVASLFYIGTQRPTLHRDWLPSNIFTCSSPRQRNTGIAPPVEPDRNKLTTLWEDLWLTFTTHGAMPHRLDMPSGHTPDDIASDVRKLVEMTDAEAEAARNSHAEMVAHIPPFPVDVFKGAGIVMLAGGRYSEYAATTLGMLREVGSRLPVELWAIKPEEELPGWCDELVVEGIACRRLSDYVDVTALSNPYQYKVLSMLLSSFEEIIFLDADSIPLQAPDSLFTTEPYRSAGVVLWPDYWDSTASAWTPYILGLSPHKGHMFTEDGTAESGQLMWNKRSHWRGLVLAAYYNFLGPDFYFTLISSNFHGWGDKDTFPWALRALGEDYYQVPRNHLGTVFRVPTSADPNNQGIGMAQADPRRNDSSVPLFLHNNYIKYSMRAFLCVSCTTLWVDGLWVDPSRAPDTKLSSEYSDKEAMIYGNLHENKRIFKGDDLIKAGMDPEPLIWKAIEHTACRSAAWGSQETCELAREHMKATFGFDFRPTHVDKTTGRGDQLCVIDPPNVGKASPSGIPARRSI